MKILERLGDLDARPEATSALEQAWREAKAAKAKAAVEAKVVAEAKVAA